MTCHRCDGVEAELAQLAVLHEQHGDRNRIGCSSPISAPGPGRSVSSAVGGAWGAAAGQLIGGVITTTITWRARLHLPGCGDRGDRLLSRRMEDPVAPDPTRPFDTGGAVLSPLAWFSWSWGILQAENHLVITAALLAVGALVLAWFFHHVRALESAGREPLLSTGLFRNHTSNLAPSPRTSSGRCCWARPSSCLPISRWSVATTPSRQASLHRRHAGILISSLAAERLAKRLAQRTLIVAGFTTTGVGILFLVAMVKARRAPTPSPPASCSSASGWGSC